MFTFCRMCDIVPVRGNNLIGVIGMGKSDLRTVIAPSGYARSSDLRVSNVIKGLIGRSLDDCLRNRGMTSFKQGVTCILWMFGLSVSMVCTARAECTPTPDCAAIGYTESSCDGKFTRCPFDTSKLFCVPCDSAYRYTCTGDYATGASGTACLGKYAGCECVAGAVLGETTCECDTSCSVGNIFYSDGSCSSCLDNEKTPVGVIVKKNKIVMSKDKARIRWATTQLTDVSGISNITSSTIAATDYAGIINSEKIVATYTTETSNNNAAIYCHEFSPTGFESSKGQWYLPAAGQILDYVYDNYASLKNTYINLLGWSNYLELFWTSTEYNDGLAWVMYTGDGVLSTRGKDDINPAVSCFLNIN